jgi:RecA/RadA recombinase
VQILTGDIDAERLLAEGLDDLTCESSASQQVQVKSRQERVGEFQSAEVVRFIVQAWQRQLKRVQADADESVVVVVERAVDGYAPQAWTRRLDTDSGWVGLVAAVRRRADEVGIAADGVDLLLARTSVVVLPQQHIFDAAAAQVAARTGLPLGATLPVIQALRAAVAEHADRNAEVGWEGRVGLTRTDIERIVTETAALVDRDSLEVAIATGACQVVDFETPLADPEFYSGTGTQPGHIAAGLVTPRPTVTDEILAGLGSGRAVLIAGPSGIGKSAVLWMAAYVARHVVWYRVHRLGDDDVEPLIRLAVAAGAGRHGPVGFVVDGIGTGSLTTWDELHRRAAAVPGVLLLGSVREEDTLPLETFGEAVVVRPRLDADLAARIQAGLLASGATTQPHWREAFDQSDGLTLEFTHLLSQGRRLRDVIGDQVRDRVREHRTVELAVIAPVSVAHQWGAEIPVARLAALVTASAGEIKASLTRLTDEHVVTVEDGMVRGLHPVRSAALCEAVHEVPPPTLVDTVRDVVTHVDSDHLLSFVAQAIADDAGLGPAVVDSLSSRIQASSGDVTLLGAALAGLRLADFTLMARRWAAILEHHDVPIPHRALGMDLAMIDSELVDALDARLISAIEDIRADRASSGFPLRDQLLARIGVDALSDLLHHATSVSEAAALLAPLAGTGAAITSPPADAPLRAALRDAPLAEVGELIATAGNVSASAGSSLAVAVGGQETVLERLMHDHPWLLDLDVVDDGDDRVLRGRVLHVADRHNPNAERYVKDLAALGLRCLPDVDRADLTTVLPGGTPLRINDVELAVSGLLRRYAVSDSEVTWNRQRSRFARSLVSAPSTTQRLVAGLAVLEDTANFLADLADAWVTDRGVGQRLDALNKQRGQLLEDIDALAPERGGQPLAGPVDQPGGMLRNDPIHGVAQGIVRNLPPRLEQSSGYAALAAFAGDTIAGLVDDARHEPWGLLGLDGPPPVLDRLVTLLDQLATVLVEQALGDTTGAQVAAVTRALPRGRGLARAADLAKTRARRRYELTLGALVSAAAAEGVQLEAKSMPHPNPQVVTWPSLATALLAQVDGSQLDQVIGTVAELLTRFALPGDSVIVIPVQDGVPLLRYTVRLFASGTVYPLPDEAEAWLELIPPVKPMPCSAAVVDAVEALHERSALAWLSTQRDVGVAVQQAVDETARRFDDAQDRLEALPSDDVTAGLIEQVDLLADRVRREVDEQTTEGVFAQALASGLTANPDDSFFTVAGLQYVATQWDLDPARALDFFNTPVPDEQASEQ